MPCGRAVFDGDRAIDAVPGAADEVEASMFSVTLTAAVAGDDDVGNEVFDAEFFGASGGGASKRDDHQSEQGEPAKREAGRRSAGGKNCVTNYVQRVQT